MTSASPYARPRYCSMSTNVVLPLAAPRVSKSCSTMAGARPWESSSMTATLGWVTRMRASESICCSPPDSMPARVPRRGPGTGRSSAAWSRRSALPSAGQALHAEAEVLRHGQGPGRRRRPRGRRPCPVGPVRWSGSWLTSSPSKKDRPRLATARAPAMAAPSVDLPAPLGPSTQQIWPGCIETSMPCRAERAP